MAGIFKNSILAAIFSTFILGGALGLSGCGDGKAVDGTNTGNKSIKNTKKMMIPKQPILIQDKQRCALGLLDLSDSSVEDTLIDCLVPIPPVRVGNHVVFAMDSIDYDLCVFDLETKTYMPIELEGQEFNFSISPDGKQVAFLTDLHGKTRMGLADLETRQGKVLTDMQMSSSSEAFPPSWNSSSNRVIFQYMNFLEFRRTATSERYAPVGFDGYTLSFPIWSPDGKKIVMSAFNRQGGKLLVWDYDPKDDCLEKSEHVKEFGISGKTGAYMPRVWNENGILFEVGTKSDDGQAIVETFYLMKELGCTPKQLFTAKLPRSEGLSIKDMYFADDNRLVFSVYSPCRELDWSKFPYKSEWFAYDLQKQRIERLTHFSQANFESFLTVDEEKESIDEGNYKPKMKTYPEHELSYPIQDFAKVISIKGFREMLELLNQRAYNQQSPIRPVVATINSLEDYDTGDKNLEQFASNLFNYWGIGDQKTNKGVLILASIKNGKVTIRLGAGFDTNLYNRDLKRILDETIMPQFKAGNYDQGFYNGLDEIITLLESK